MTMPDATQRLRRCACGVQFATAETVIRRLPMAPVSPVTARQRPPDTGGTGNPPATATAAGGVGGGLPSDSDPIRKSDSGPISVADPIRVRARGKRRATREIYPEAFEIEWNQTAKLGAKDKACEAWERLGNPAFGAAWLRWEESPQWAQEWYHPPHVSTWLNDGRWKQDPRETRVKVAVQRPPETFEARRKREQEEATARESERLVFGKEWAG